MRREPLKGYCTRCGCDVNGEDMQVDAHVTEEIRYGFDAAGNQTDADSKASVSRDPLKGALTLCCDAPAKGIRFDNESGDLVADGAREES